MPRAPSSLLARRPPCFQEERHSSEGASVLVKSAWLPPLPGPSPAPLGRPGPQEGLRPSRHSLGPADLGAGDGTDEGHHPAVVQEEPHQRDGRLLCFSLQTSPRMWAADAETGWRRVGRAEPARPQPPGATPTTHAAQAAEQRACPRPWGRSQRTAPGPTGFCSGVERGVPVWVWVPVWGVGLWLSCGLGSPPPGKRDTDRPEH